MDPSFISCMDFKFVGDCAIKILLSIVCGFVLGVERKSRNHAVGIRTLILICVSSALLSILSTYIPTISQKNADSTRIIAGVVSGIGFLGGGAIMRQGMNIKGLTSAAIIWTAAALGLALGAGLYIQSVLVLVVVELILVLIEKLEFKWFPAAKTKSLHLVYENVPVDTAKIRQTILESGVKIIDLNLTRDISRRTLILHYSIKLSSLENFEPLVQQLSKIGDLTEFSMTD